QVNGNRIIADVGHDLLISSQQDTSKYDSKQTSVAAGGSFTFGSMTGSGYIAASRDKMKSRFDSVAEQTGMFAGDGGFDITVGRHTQLDGAVIASTATPDKNHLDTGTLGFSDLHNEADYKVSHSGISLSGGGSFGDKFQGNMPGGMISAGGHSGHAEGTTQAAVAEGTITIRDRDNQKQNLANLSRDPVHANDSISPIFDKEKEQRRLQTVGLISDIGSQVADIARTQGELNALKAAQDKYGPVPADATEEQRQAYLAKLRDTPEYKKEQEKYGTGSDMQRGIQAATAALQGLAGGNMAGALAGASAPELAHLLKSTEKDPAVNAIAHAILGGAVAAMQGNNVAAGAAGAATGELAARAIAGMLYPGVKQSDLSEEQKQTISTLATVSAGLTGGLTGNSTASAAVGAQSGKNAVENNALGNKNDKLPPIIPINPLPIGVEGADGEPLNGGGGIAKGGKSKDTQIWTETKKVEPVGNAYGHWTKHGKEFPEYQNAKQYVDAAHNFMTNPPPGTLTKTRPKGDTLYYNPVTNVFASKDINGVPRTMFKPEKGIEYWNKQ
ncbi:Contact-dependent inhibitor A, partial [Escherichia coli]|nr:Contact-dependent inhibitor A [Escherichia coli]